MAVFGEGADKKFSMNPQVGRAMHKATSSGPVAKESAPATGKAHHVEVHRGGHPDGNPPMDETSTHHTIHHSDTGEADIRNHSGYDDAEASIRASMCDEESSETQPDNEAGEGEY